MSSVMIAFLIVALAGIGARDQMTLVGLSQAQGMRPSVLIIALVVSVGSAVAATLAGMWMAPSLEPKAQWVLTAMAFGLACIEFWFVQPKDSPKEPTLSLGATSMVLIYQQATDAARFLIFGLATSSALPLGVAFGGTMGAVITVGLGWGCYEFFENRSNVRLLRQVLSVVFAIMGGMIFYRAMV